MATGRARQVVRSLQPVAAGHSAQWCPESAGPEWPAPCSPVDPVVYPLDATALKNASGPVKREAGNWKTDVKLVKFAVPGMPPEMKDGMAKMMAWCYFMEMQWMHSAAINGADFFHGPLAIIERRFPVILFGPSGVTQRSNVDLLNRLKELHADCLSITNSDAIADLSSHSLRLPADIDENLTPIPFAIPAQLFAAYLSKAKGLDPDSPRSLTKVTKTV